MNGKRCVCSVLCPQRSWDDEFVFIWLWIVWCHFVSLNVLSPTRRSRRSQYSDSSWYVCAHSFETIYSGSPQFNRRKCIVSHQRLWYSLSSPHIVRVKFPDKKRKNEEKIVQIPIQIFSSNLVIARHHQRRCRHWSGQLQWTGVVRFQSSLHIVWQSVQYNVQNAGTILWPRMHRGMSLRRRIRRIFIVGRLCANRFAAMQIRTTSILTSNRRSFIESKCIYLFLISKSCENTRHHPFAIFTFEINLISSFRQIVYLLIRLSPLFGSIFNVA